MLSILDWGVKKPLTSLTLPKVLIIQDFVRSSKSAGHLGAPSDASMLKKASPMLENWAILASVDSQAFAVNPRCDLIYVMHTPVESPK
jgi:hypothetical protein